MNRIFEYHKSLKRDCLYSTPVIIEVNSFDEKGFAKFGAAMEDAHNTGQSFIPIIIDSYGGEVYSLNGMVDIIRNSKIPVYTILLGKAMSCGAVLFTCGERRFMSQHSKLMIHEASSGGRDKISELEVSVEETRKINDKIYEIMAENCGKSKNYFKKISKDKGNVDWYLDTDEALEHNLATDIGLPNMKVKIDVTTELDF